MMKISFLTVSLLLITNVYSQKDTLAPNKKLSYTSFIAPAALITGGTILLNSYLNDKLQEKSGETFRENFHTSVDNVLPFIPLAQIYTGKYLGYKPKNDVLHQSINIAIANTIAVSLIEVTKHTVKEQRPDQSDLLSFPSGHTAIAFTNASLLYYEYKDSNLWYASSGFLFATATGILRIANNRHYTSDVLAGAGIGLASGLIVSYWRPFHSLTFGKNKKTTAFIYPEIGNQIGIGLLIKPR